MIRNKIRSLFYFMIGFFGFGPLEFAFAEAQYESRPHWSCLKMKEPDVRSLFKTQWLRISGYPISAGQDSDQRIASTPVLRAFISDGCSLSPDRFPVVLESENWIDCCVAHDIEYWLGGTQAEKQMADVELKTCIAKKGFPKVAKIYEQAVQSFGGWDSSTTFRWGYGWNFKRPYSPLLASELKMAGHLAPGSHTLHRDSIKKSLIKNTHIIYEFCDVVDRGLTTLDQDEMDILKALKLKLQPGQKERVIEWAKLKNQNPEKKVFEIKLVDCKVPFFVVSHFNRKTFEIEKNTCGL